MYVRAKMRYNVLKKAYSVFQSDPRINCCHNNYVPKTTFSTSMQNSHTVWKKKMFWNSHEVKIQDIIKRNIFE